MHVCAIIVMFDTAAEFACPPWRPPLTTPSATPPAAELASAPSSTPPECGADPYLGADARVAGVESAIWGGHAKCDRPHMGLR